MLTFFKIRGFCISDYKNIWDNKRMHSYKNGLWWHDHDKWECHIHCQWNNPWCNCEKQDYLRFSFLNKVICDTSMQSVWMSEHCLEDVFELLLNIFTYHLAEYISWKSSKFSKIHMKFYPEHANRIQIEWKNIHIISTLF